MELSAVESMFGALAGGEPAAIAAVFTPEAEWVSPPGNAVALATGAGAHLVGRTAIARFFGQELPRLFARDLHVDLLGSHAAGDRVTVEATVSATLADGGHYSNDYCFVLTLRDGLIHRVREYADTARGNRLIFGEPAATG